MIILSAKLINIHRTKLQALNKKLKFQTISKIDRGFENHSSTSGMKEPQVQVRWMYESLTVENNCIVIFVMHTRWIDNLHLTCDNKPHDILMLSVEIRSSITIIRIMSYTPLDRKWRSHFNPGFSSSNPSECIKMNRLKFDTDEVSSLIQNENFIMESYN